MKRNICLINKSVPASFQGFDNIVYTNIDSIVNNSVDILYCDILNEINIDEYNHMLPLMLNKIRLGGQLVLVIQDIKSLASMYASNSINDEDLLLKVKNLKNIISLPKIEKLVNDKQEFVLINLQTQNNQHTIVLQREKI